MVRPWGLLNGCGPFPASEPSLLIVGLAGTSDILSKAGAAALSRSIVSRPQWRHDGRCGPARRVEDWAQNSQLRVGHHPEHPAFSQAGNWALPTR